MQIQIEKSDRREYYQEAMNVAQQYRRLIQRPDRKLKDIFREMKNFVIIGGVLFAFVLLLSLLAGFDASSLFGLLLSVAVMVMGGSALRSLNRRADAVMQNSGTGVLTLDEEAVTLDRSTGQSVRIAWEGVAFVRVFRETVCFLPDSSTSFVITVGVKYKDEILAWLKENQPGVTCIE